MLLLHYRGAELEAAEKAKRAFAARVEEYFAGRRLGSLDLLRVAEKMGVSEEDARSVGREKYQKGLSLMLHKGGLSETEERKLTKLARLLHVSYEEKVAAERAARMQKAAAERAAKSRKAAAERAAKMRKTAAERAAKMRKRAAERAAKHQIVDAEVAEILADGRVGENDSDRLRSLADRLGLTVAEIRYRAANEAGEAFSQRIHMILHHGRFTKRDEVELKRIQKVFGDGVHEAKGLPGGSAADCIRKFSELLATQENVDPAATEHLERLARVLAVPQDDLEPHRNRLAEVVKISRARSGDLDPVDSPLGLASDEFCYWFGEALHTWKNQSGEKDAVGTLAITSKRVIFNSPTKNFELRPTKIVRLTEASRGQVHVQASVSRGNGRYKPRRSSEYERFPAVLSGVVKKVNYRAESTGSKSRKQIPDHVRQEVWQRDGGQCVRCGAEEYLEFDHVIPHSKGGADTVRNLQLLCRHCNNEKSDRI